MADSSLQTEVRGLTDTHLRPADILTTAAVPGRSAALDVCIASSSAAAAHGDACEAAFRRKLQHYRDIIPQLAEAEIAFRPMVWTADGRPHPAVVRTLRFAAKLAASRANNDTTAAAILGRWRHELQVTIQRRRAAMARAVLPRVSARAAWFLTGRAEEGSSSIGRAPFLEGDEELVCGDEQASLVEGIYWGVDGGVEVDRDGDGTMEVDMEGVIPADREGGSGTL